MHLKKGQVSIFGILAIVLLIVAGSYSLMESDVISKGAVEVQNVQSFEPNIGNLNQFVETCLSRTGEEAISFVGLQGGYEDVNSVKFLYEPPFYTAYHFYEGRDLTPSINRVEQEISSFMVNYLPDCLQEFEVFKQRGISVSHGEPLITTSLREGSAYFSLTLPLEIETNEGKQSLSGFNAEVRTPLRKMLDVASILTQQQVADPQYICLSCILQETAKRTLGVELIQIDNLTYIMVMNDSSTGLQLIYANKYEEYGCNNPPPDTGLQFNQNCLNSQIAQLGYTFTVENIPDFMIRVGEPFTYQVTATGRNVIFEKPSNSNWPASFSIGQTTGKIQFTPQATDVGEHLIWMQFKDDLGGNTYRSFKITVVQ